MQVSLWFDPACPFCWITSRWLISVAPARDIEIDWQPISLYVKNDPPPDSPYHDSSKRTHGLLRVVESLRAAGHADRIGDVYREFGRHIHHERNHDFDVAAVLTELGLHASHATAVDDEAFDTEIRRRMDVGLALTGPDVGTPLLAITDDAGERVGLFGPVITTFPEPDAALRLWDGFVAMATVPGFYELKRARTTGPDLPPDDKI
jgi:hypothetical protein